ncbi:hypothetical protein D0X99_15125 [Algoriphagus lacus]|uniref:Uncharacterized protein n=1 Tax=Algoriphagus lacus TaxID=2056311 RepID=A0A418PNP3_9BACT|nr:hypothetical protein [Algoriphagus lacus]RIW13579.1 hypothetical protein D0X99_15125 [Algoriphagus lacus]
MSFVYLSNFNQSAISFGGNLTVSYGTDSSGCTELLLQAIQMNRRLVAAISSEWESENQCLDHVSRLIEECMKLELTVAENLKTRQP